MADRTGVHSFPQFIVPEEMRLAYTRPAGRNMRQERRHFISMEPIRDLCQQKQDEKEGWNIQADDGLDRSV